jgi:hypothetical protein
MKTVTDVSQIQKYKALVSEMTEYRTEFSPHWLARTGWKVVPDESGGRLFREDIPRLVSVLNAAGFFQCFALTTEDLGDTPPCYHVQVSEEGFHELNRELGIFQFLLTEETRSWAISCTVFYNLFGGPERFVEAMLGKTVPEAESDFLEIATRIAKGNPNDLFLKVARRYAS